MPSLAAPAEILILKPSSLGDIVHTLPAVAALKQHWPASRVSWLINPEWAPLLAGNPDVAEIVPFPRRDFRGLAGWLKIPAWARQMAAHPADLVVDFQGLLRTALIARLSRRGETAGLSDAREGARLFYTRVADVSGCRHAVDRYLALVASLGANTAGPLAWPLPEGTAPVGFAAAAPWVLLHPYSRGAGKSLSATEVDDFCRALAPRQVVLVGQSPAPPPAVGNVIDLLNRTSLLELIWLIRRAAFVVSVDSGPMHIAAAITSSTLAIHKWSDPQKVGPYRPEAWVWKDGVVYQMQHRSTTAAHRACADLAAIGALVARLLPGRSPARDPEGAPGAGLR